MSAVAPVAPPAAPAAPTKIPWLGLTAVLLGTFISTLNTRLSTFGLADIRGAVHAGFDDGAWITTAQTVAQMLICPIAIWMGTVLRPPPGVDRSGARLRGHCVDRAFRAEPAHVAGAAVRRRPGVRIFRAADPGLRPRNMPPKAWAYGIAIYALNLEVSLNISASLEGWYVDHLSWRWIFWQKYRSPSAWRCSWPSVPTASPPNPSAETRLLRLHLRRPRFGSHLCGSRPGQPPGLAQLRPGLGTAGRGRHPVGWLPHP